MPVTICNTQRLSLREVTVDDADFIVNLLNQPSFLEHIGDKGVRDAADARNFIVENLRASYLQHGFGLWAVELHRTPIGLCGLLKRDYLADADLGFAFLPQYWSQGFAYESATAVLRLAVVRFHFNRVLAIASPDNAASISLLEKLGFQYQKPVRIPADDHDISLFSVHPDTGEISRGTTR